MCARSRALFEQVGGAPGDDLLAERDKGDDDVAQGHLLGPAAVQRQHVDAEAGLQRGVAVELVQHDVGIGVALQFDDEAHAVAVALVAHVGDALDELLADAFGDALLQLRLVHLIRHLGEDDRLAVLADLLDVVSWRAARSRRARSGRRRAVPARPMMMPPVGKSGAGTYSISSSIGDRRVVEIGAAGVDDLAEIVRRDVGRHADRDALRAVDQQVREAGRQDLRLALGLVVIGLEIDRVLVEIVEQRRRRRARAAPRCSGRPPAGRRPSSRNCPGRRSAAGASRNPAPSAPSRRRSRARRAGGICPSRRRRCAPICGSRGSTHCRSSASNRGCGDAPASARRGHRAARAPRSRSSRNRGRSAASPLRS